MYPLCNSTNFDRKTCPSQKKSQSNFSSFFYVLWVQPLQCTELLVVSHKLFFKMIFQHSKIRLAHVHLHRVTTYMYIFQCSTNPSRTQEGFRVETFHGTIPTIRNLVPSLYREHLSPYSTGNWVRVGYQTQMKSTQKT